MNKLIIPLHSMVDLITNSSSELFICNTRKSVDTVKEILHEICLKYNQNGGYINTAKLFADQDPDPSNQYSYVFGRIEASKFDFPSCNDFYTYTELTKSIHYTITDPAKENQLRDWKRNNPVPEWTHPPSESYYRNYSAYNRRKKDFCDILFADEYQRQRESYHNLLSKYCQLNYINYDNIAKAIKEDSFDEKLHFMYDDTLNKHEKEFINEFNMCINWQVNINRGDILIESATDNSIPYDIWDEIQAIFCAKRIHMG